MIEQPTTSDKQEELPTDERTDPAHALEGCREYGLTEGEGQWIYDLRAGYLQLQTFTPTHVTAVSESGQFIVIGTAVDLYNMCRSNSIYPISSSAIVDASSIVLALATQRLDDVTKQHDLDEPWSPTETAETVADVAAAVHFLDRVTSQHDSLEELLSDTISH